MQNINQLLIVLDIISLEHVLIAASNRRLYLIQMQVIGYIKQENSDVFKMGLLYI